MPLGRGQVMAVTVLFADCRGFSALTRRLPPQELVKLMNRYFETCTDIALRHDGCIDKLLGDALMVVFGAPIARPDHPLQAVIAAQEMLESVCALSEDLRVGIAINTGEAVVGNVGGQGVRDFTAMGDTVNVASHLQIVARPNEILLTQHTYEQVRTQYPHAAPRTVPIKGLEGLSQVFALTSSGDQL